MSLLRNIGRAFSTGRSAAKRAAKAAEQYAMQAAEDRKRLEAKTEKEKARAQKLALRGLRSRRAASRNYNEAQGVPTIG